MEHYFTTKEGKILKVKTLKGKSVQFTIFDSTLHVIGSVTLTKSQVDRLWYDILN